MLFASTDDSNVLCEVGDAGDWANVHAAAAAYDTMTCASDKRRDEGKGHERGANLRVCIRKEEGLGYWSWIRTEL